VEEQQPKKISSAHESLLQLSEPANVFNLKNPSSQGQNQKDDFSLKS
jgi:hypothetical protein